MNEELLKGLSQEQIEKARKCKSTDELSTKLFTSKSTGK